MQPIPNKLAVRKRSNGVKERENLIPCEDKNFGTNINKSTGKKTYLNLYILGKLWIDLLSKALVGEKVEITSIKATQTSESSLKNNEIKPQLPIQYQDSIIKYKDLPVYQDQNIGEYGKEMDKKTFFADNVMRLHNILVPYMSYIRSTLQRTVNDAKSYVLNEFERRKDEVINTRATLRENMRDPDTLPYRYTGAATGGVAGYILGASGGISRRVVFTSLGLLSAGVVCFPKESDKIFKDVMYKAAKACVYLYNTVTDDELQLRREAPVEIDVPTPDANKLIVECPTE